MENDNEKLKIVKQKRYWLRCAVGSSVLYAILFNTIWLFTNAFVLFIFLDLSTPRWKMVISFFWDDFTIPGIMLTMIWGIVFYFVVGGIIGGLYGKIKNRNLPTT